MCYGTETTDEYSYTVHAPVFVEQGTKAALDIKYTHIPFRSALSHAIAQTRCGMTFN